VLVTFNVVQNEDEPVTGGKIGHRAFQRQPVNGAGQGQIGSPKAPPRISLRCGFHGFIHRHERQPFLSQMHQHYIDRQSVQPGGKRGVAAERGNLAVQLKKCFLGQILGLCHIPHHAQT